MQNSPIQYTSQEIDRLYVRWILGRNRQLNTLLDSELAALIESGKVKHEQLTKVELSRIQDLPNSFRAGDSFSNSNQDKSPEIYASLLKDEINHDQDLMIDFRGSIEKMAELIIEGLLINSQLEYADRIGNEVWKKLDTPTQKKLGFALFINTYNISPRTFRDELIRQMSIN